MYDSKEGVGDNGGYEGRQGAALPNPSRGREAVGVNPIQFDLAVVEGIESCEGSGSRWGGGPKAVKAAMVKSLVTDGNAAVKS